MCDQSHNVVESINEAWGTVFADLVHQVQRGALCTALESEHGQDSVERKIFDAAARLRDLIDETVCDGCGGIIGQCSCEDGE